MRRDIHVRVRARSLGFRHRIGFAAALLAFAAPQQVAVTSSTTGKTTKRRRHAYMTWGVTTQALGAPAGRAVAAARPTRGGRASTRFTTMSAPAARFVLACGTAGSMSAQSLASQVVQVASSPNATVLVAQLATPLPEGARAYVIRRASAHPSNSIVLGSDADAPALSAAIAVLRRSRVVDGDALDRDRQIVVTSSPDEHLRPKLRAALAHEIVRLRNAPTRQLEGVGTVRALERVLPPPKATDRGW